MKKTFSPEYLEYLQSEDWAQLKHQAFKHYGHTCQYCGSWHYEHCIQIHHIRYPRPLNSATIKDVIPLCKSCHEEIHQYLEYFKEKPFTTRAIKEIIAQEFEPKSSLEFVKDIKKAEIKKLTNDAKSFQSQAKVIPKKKWQSRAQQHFDELERKLA